MCLPAVLSRHCPSEDVLPQSLPLPGEVRRGSCICCGSLPVPSGAAGPATGDAGEGTAGGAAQTALSTSYPHYAVGF
jgi:hypothetical protein